jgi:hypothetical protein
MTGTRCDPRSAHRRRSRLIGEAGSEARREAHEIPSRAPPCQWRLHHFVRAAGLAAERPIAMIEPPTDAVESLFRDLQRLDARQRAAMATHMALQNREARHDS